MSSMIHSARPTALPVARIILTFTWGRMVDICDNNDPYRSGMWVGLVDQQNRMWICKERRQEWLQTQFVHRMHSEFELHFQGGTKTFSRQKGGLLYSTIDPPGHGGIGGHYIRP